MDKKRFYVSLFILVFIVGVIILFRNEIYYLFTNLGALRDLVLRFETIGAIVFILLCASQVVAGPVPGQFVGLAGGYIFGVWKGTLYTTIGLTIGSFIAFWIGREFGRPLVEKIIDKKTLAKTDRVVAKGSMPVIFLIYLLPLLPDDILCYTAGLTKIKIKYLMIISTIGRLPGTFVLSVVGAGMMISNFVIILIALACIAIFVCYFYRKGLEKMMWKLVGKVGH